MRVSHWQPDADTGEVRCTWDSHPDGPQHRLTHVICHQHRDAERMRRWRTPRAG